MTCLGEMMTDTCKHCTLRGDFALCQRTPCHTHDSWYVQQMRQEMDALEAEYNYLERNLDAVYGERNMCEQALDDRDAEIARLRGNIHTLLERGDALRNDKKELQEIRAIREDQLEHCREENDDWAAWAMQAKADMESLRTLVVEARDIITSAAPGEEVWLDAADAILKGE
jgi:chromosome segregation ATPase